MAGTTVLKLTSRCQLTGYSQPYRPCQPQKRLHAVPKRDLRAAFVTAVVSTFHKQQDQRCLLCRAQHDLVIPATPLEPVTEQQASGGARELLTWVYELPWTRVAIWATVALTASQFQDFFGVNNDCTHLSFQSYSPQASPKHSCSSPHSQQLSAKLAQSNLHS